MTTYSTTSRAESVRRCTDLLSHQGFSSKSRKEPIQIRQCMFILFIFVLSFIFLSVCGAFFVCFKVNVLYVCVSFSVDCLSFSLGEQHMSISSHFSRRPTVQCRTTGFGRYGVKPAMNTKNFALVVRR